MKKYTRQRIILDLIDNHEIETQEELARLLKEKGIKITQATISRDIKDLRLIKVLTEGGKYKYASVDYEQEGVTERLIIILKTSVLDLSLLENLIIIKTLPGAAQVCASVIEDFNVKGIKGTIAGDDTIFVAAAQADIECVFKNIEKILK